jgi:hypothetical protein
VKPYNKPNSGESSHWYSVKPGHWLHHTLWGLQDAARDSAILSVLDVRVRWQKVDTNELLN